MKYYAVTDDPRELYHYGVKGMKWGQHIFGDKPKSPGYHKATQKLKSIISKAAKTTSSSFKTIGKAAQKTSQQKSYNAKAKQSDNHNKLVSKYQDQYEKKYSESSARADKAFTNTQNTKRKLASVLKTTGSAAAKFPGQIAYNVRRAQDAVYNKSVEKAQKRNNLASAMRGLDREESLRKQVDHDRKVAQLQERQAKIIANNDLKTLRKAARVEKNMPKYIQEARTGELKYGKLSDEQIGRLQNRLALEANTRRLGNTEAPSWRTQKKMARRQGYLQGITKGISAGMEEVARAGVQYGIRNLANRKKMDAAAELRAEREKNASRIKNARTDKEIRQDLRKEAYEQEIRSGSGFWQRGFGSHMTVGDAAKKLQKYEDDKQERQNKLNEAREERKFLMDERHNAARLERQRQERLTEADDDIDRIGKSLYENGYALVPSYNKDGKKIGVKILTSDGSNGQADKRGNITGDDGPAYLKLYQSKYDLPDKQAKQPKLRSEEEKALSAAGMLNSIRADSSPMTKESIQKEANQRSKEFFKDHDAHLENERKAHEKAEQRRRELAEKRRLAEQRQKELLENPEFIRVINEVYNVPLQETPKENKPTKKGNKKRKTGLGYQQTSDEFFGGSKRR